MKLTLPDAYGMAYLEINKDKVSKTITRQVNYDLDSDGLLVGIEFFDMPIVAAPGSPELEIIEGE